MSRLPIGIGATGLIAVVVGLAAFLSNSGAIHSSSALMIALGVLGGTLVALSSLLLVRAPWGRWALTGAIVTSALLASISDSLIFLVSLVLAAVAIVGLWGPWLTLWLRQAPNTEGLGWGPVVLLTSVFWMPIVVAAGSHEGLVVAHWLLVILVVLAGWAYGRGLAFGLWGFRVALPIAALITMTLSTVVGAVSVGLGAGVVTAVAWNRRARQATAVITPPLRPPVARSGGTV